MMKHGLMLFALGCGMAMASFGSANLEVWQELTPQELDQVEGGDLMLSVNRDKQMMTVTRITPGSYDNIQCFSVKVTTSVVRNQDVAAGNPKGAMENTNRTIPGAQDKTFAKQFPSGTATVMPVTTTQKGVEGPVIKTNATQPVTVVDDQKTVTGERPDGGYNVHYSDPAKTTNTLGCVGVQSQEGMAKVTEALKTDNSSYSKGTKPNQTITVSSYSDGVPPASTFQAKEIRTPPNRGKTAL